MANTITALMPDIYEALDVVSRELTGMIPAVTMNASAERAGLNQNIRVDVEPAGNVANITPAMVVPDPTGQTSGSTDIIITKARAAEFGFNGDEQKILNTGIGYTSVRAQKIAQAIRSITNEVEVDLAGLQSTFSRAVGTAGTTPFGTANNYTDASKALQVLKDNGAPLSDNQLVINTNAGVNLLGLQSAVNAAGTDSMLRQGVLLDINGMPIRESAQIVNQAAASLAGAATTNAAGYAVGANVLTLAAGGTGTVGAGDVITFAGDTNQYVVTSAVFAGANPAAGDTITLAANGLRVAMSAATKAITKVAASDRNMAFNRSALVLAARAPARPEEGDQAEDVIVITDPRSGLSMEFAMYKGYRKVRYEVGLAWGVKNIKPEHTALLLG
jgi:hypothetical protein|tara:strand:- start:869 stop:2032 length:1164 start_codon:yes stop_codon:yes gene_type:complete